MKILDEMEATIRDIAMAEQNARDGLNVIRVMMRKLTNDVEKLRTKMGCAETNGQMRDDLPPLPKGFKFIEMARQHAADQFAEAVSDAQESDNAR